MLRPPTPISKTHNKKFSYFPTGTTSVFLLKYLLLFKHSLFGAPAFSETLSTDSACLWHGLE